jgi:hypothetical protein
MSSDTVIIHRIDFISSDADELMEDNDDNVITTTIRTPLMKIRSN